MNKDVLLTKSAEETKKIGKDFAKFLKKGDILSLSGDLGAGKTTFTQGVASGLGIERRIISPTFVVIRQYQAPKKITVYHIDLYRMNTETDISNLGLNEVFDDKNGIFIIEWAKRSNRINPSWEVEFRLKEGGREIEIKKV